ncbi:MAG: oligosaccharide repeat unit polymerase [Actinomycetia bacterium]|nr:oligosaccharide repeat unit polymerase [Actinomycetes bacterium]
MIILCSILFFGIGAYLAFRATRNLLSPLFISVGMMLFNYTGGVIIFLTEGRILIPLFISIGVLFYGLGAMFLAAYLHFKPAQELTKFREQPFFSVFPDTRVFFINLIAVFLITVSLTVYYYHIAGIPLFSGDVSVHALTQHLGIFVRSFTTFLPVVILIAYLFVRVRNTLGANIFLYIGAITAITVIAFTGMRGAAIGYIIPLVIIYGLISRKINWFRLTVVFLVFFVVAIVLQYRYFGWEDLPLRDALLLLGSRMTISQVMGADYIIHEIVPQTGFFMGEIAWNEFKGILAVLRILPEHPTPFWITLFEIMHGVDPRAAFVMTTTPIGDLYIDFGVPGIVLGMFFFGVIAQLLYVKTLRYPKDYLILPVMVYLQYTLVSTHITGSFFNVFGQYGISLIVITLVILGLTLILSLPLGRIVVKLPKREVSTYGEHKL